MADVARVAGVSITTVSHVVNASRYVAPETREKVRSALETLSYTAPPPVVAAPTGRVIGLAVTGISNAYFAELIQGVESEARRQGFALLLCDSHDDPAIEASAVATLLAHNVEAVILAPTVGWEETTLPVLRHRATPFVLVDRMSTVRCDQVGAENQAVSAALVDHLIERGHRRIGLLAGLDGLSTSTERSSGYRHAHDVAGLAVDESLVAAGHSTVSGGRAATTALLRGEDPPTAIFSTNNAMSVGALLAVKELGLRIPDDVALVAFDDFEWAGAMSPALTAAAQPFHAMGARAVQLLVHRLADPAAPQRIVRLPVEIEHRESCGCVRP
ncbi:LacI family DNA-binding transcriptional regulator [Labedaea rhizosphaerae]|uniref:LacI family transcriptional regulator n=1 Tax=Labedaea rhizosphaerae TaxID=598644 RepID=A0A4R6SHP9_LABRH|nr:LacI family DNA-binding transcriptional regulator [Labedaea rhizosphaerae]TDQ00389.1 LacI family transcriptional regulator [Labedaea rhizosphaerae]